MTEEPLGLRVLVEVGLSHVEGIFPNINTTLYDQLGQIMESYLRGYTSFEMAQQYFLSMFGRIDPLIHIRDIALLRDNPIPSNDSDEPDESDEVHSRKKTRTWTNYEDQRLLAGIYRFGLDNWTRVAQFVGNNRTRAQCSQRWNRGLNPRICKKHWSPEEDAQLIQLVQTYGEKSWTKISSCLGNRSDVQCRYHYRQISRDNRPNYMRIGKANSAFSMPTVSVFSTTHFPIPPAVPPSKINNIQLPTISKRKPSGNTGFLMLSQQKLIPSLSQSATVLPHHVSSATMPQSPDPVTPVNEHFQLPQDTASISYPYNKDLDSFLLHFK